MNAPVFLKKGDKVAIVATARKISREEISYALEILRSWDLIPVLGRNLFKEFHQFAGSDLMRVKDFQQVLDDKEIKAVLFARGGYGTVRIIDKINLKKFQKSPKWVAGYSDATVVHSHLFASSGIPSIHASMPINFKNNTKESLNSLRNALFGYELSYSLPAHPLNRKGSAEGIVVGGNLSLLVNLIGTKSDVDTKGKILFIEDLDEYLYHIDRMMMQMKRAGKLGKLRGLIVGGMTKMKDNEVPFGKNAEEIIAEKVAEYKYPVCFAFPAGHIDDNRALYLGRKAHLKVSSQVSLSY